jgi:hypothetical protein
MSQGIGPISKVRLHHADAHAPVYAIDECVFKEDRKPRRCDCAAYDVLQLRSHSSDVEGDTRNGGWRVGQALGSIRYRRNLEQWELANFKPEYQFVVRQYAIGKGHSVSVMWRGGEVDTIFGFEKEADALQWIRERSQEWLISHK